MAGPPGFEPGQTVLETGMLPLHHGPLSLFYFNFRFNVSIEATVFVNTSSPYEIRLFYLFLIAQDSIAHENTTILHCCCHLRKYNKKFALYGFKR